MMVKDLVKLVALLSLLAMIILGMHYLGTLEDARSKYHHPLTQPGASW